MKHITLDSFYSKPTLLMAMLVMLTLSMFAIHSKAAQTDAVDTGDKTSAQRFDHTTTGYPLTGSHATIADCGSCHVGGVFKGTPHNCNGCHTRGQRVVALTMSSNHLATTQPCDICHTNTVTFSGARYNHGMAIPGQCGSCHNGSIATARPASHSGNSFKATNSCDKCHRATVWLPSYWNHVGTIPQCGGCHAAGQLGSAWVKTNIGGTTAEGFAHGTSNNTIDCVSCHHTYTNWLGATYDHASAGGTCAACHNGIRATGTAQFSGHLPTTLDCGSCHHGYASWLGATFDHSGIGSATCSSCHNGTTATGKKQISGTSPEAFAHGALNNSIDCGSCHSGYSSWLGALYSHSGAGYSGVCSSCHNNSRATGLTQAVALYPTHVTSGECSSCHSSTSTWLGAIGGAMPTNHVAVTYFNPPTIACTACHQTPTTWIIGKPLHDYLVSNPCENCHLTGKTVLGVTQTKSHNTKSGPCASCHSSFTSWNK